MTKYAFFYDNKSFAIAESEDEKNLLSPAIPDSILKTITDSQFENVKNFKSRLKIENDIVSEENLYITSLSDTNSDIDHAKSQIQADLNECKSRVSGWLNAHNNPDGEIERYNYWKDYLTKLKTVDVESIVLPSAYETFMEWFNNQPDHPSKSPLQLP